MEAEIRFLQGWVRSSTFEYFTVNKALISTSAFAGLIETRIDTDNFIGIGAGFLCRKTWAAAGAVAGFDYREKATACPAALECCTLKIPQFLLLQAAPDLIGREAQKSQETANIQ